MDRIELVLDDLERTLGAKPEQTDLNRGSHYLVSIALLLVGLLLSYLVHRWVLLLNFAISFIVGLIVALTSGFIVFGFLTMGFSSLLLGVLLARMFSGSGGAFSSSSGAIGLGGFAGGGGSFGGGGASGSW
ncbi:MAG: hypothetical protein KDK23_04915 [Leptospiraceae bacterium]|nr:hypothetical protein [Leptospiraceae bacterium]